jgi:hypothetical protein
MDQIVRRGIRGRRFGFDFKYSDAPSLTRSMRIAADDLRLHQLWVVYPGGKSYDLEERVSVVPLPEVADALSNAV